MLDRFQLAQKIEEWVFCEKDRQILKRKLCDGATFQELASEFDMSDNGIKLRYKRALDGFTKAMNRIGYSTEDFIHQAGA